MTTLDDIAGFLGGQNSSFSPAKRLEKDTGIKPVEIVKEKVEEKPITPDVATSSPTQETSSQPQELVANVPPPLFTETNQYVDPLKGAYAEKQKNTFFDGRHFMLEPFFVKNEFR